MAKRSRWIGWLTTAASFAVVLLVMYGLYKLASSAMHALAGLNPSVCAAIVVGAVTVLSSTLAIVLGRYYEAKRAQEAAHRDKKIELYDEFVGKLFELFLSQDDAEKTTKDDWTPFLRVINRKLILWSGPGVIKAYRTWVKTLLSQLNDPLGKSFVDMADFFLALRQDLGHSNKGVGPDHILPFLLTNSELLLGMYKINPNVTMSQIIAAEKLLEQTEDNASSATAPATDNR